MLHVQIKNKISKVNFYFIVITSTVCDYDTFVLYIGYSSM